MTIPCAASATQEAAMQATIRATTRRADNAIWRGRWPNPWQAIGTIATTIEASVAQAMRNEP